MDLGSRSSTTPKAALMVQAPATPLHAPGSEPVTDTNFAGRLVTARRSQPLAQQLADRSGAHVTQIRGYEAGTSQPTLDVLRSLAPALNISADSLRFDDDERDPQSQTWRLNLEAVHQFTPEEQEHVAAFIEDALLRHHARQAFSGQAS